MSDHTHKQSWQVIQGDTRDGLRSMPERSVHTCVTSPPYWGLRDYGVDGQIGLEESPEQYVAQLVEVFREVRRVLRDDGTIWVNLGDAYAGSWGAQSRGDFTPGTLEGASAAETCLSARQIKAHPKETGTGSLKHTPGLKGKDLIGLPWMVAFALRADGWYLRSDIIWHKPNPMPESVTDRPTKGHEYLFLLAKQPRYYYDAAAIAEASTTLDDRPPHGAGQASMPGMRAASGTRLAKSGNADRKPATERGCPNDGVCGNVPWEGTTRNRRTVWTIATQPFPEAHFATFPEALVEPCIKAGSPVGGMVLDPFSGSGTTGVVALKQGRNYVGCELNPEYVQMSRRRLDDVAPLLAREIA